MNKESNAFVTNDENTKNKIVMKILSLLAIASDLLLHFVFKVVESVKRKRAMRCKEKCCDESHLRCKRHSTSDCLFSQCFSMNIATLTTFNETCARMKSWSKDKHYFDCNILRILYQSFQIKLHCTACCLSVQAKEWKNRMKRTANDRDANLINDDAFWFLIRSTNAFSQ